MFNNNIFVLCVATVATMLIGMTYGGLTPTGNIDARTPELFKKRRCSFKEVYDDDTPREKRYAIRHGWNRRDLTYKFVTNSSTLPSTLVERLFKKALAVWAPHAGLTFTQVKKGSADINVGFYSGDHACLLKFDGPGHDLAHAYYPSNGVLHFDDDKDWYDKDSGKHEKAFKFLSTAIHEIGHVLGVDHSNHRGAVMFAAYSDVTALTDDDLQAIKALYPAKHG